MDHISMDELVEDAYYWITFRDSDEETIGQWVNCMGWHFWIIGSDEPIPLKIVLSCHPVCLIKH